MKFNQYKYKFYLNANHSIIINGNMGEIHPHTWEISLDVIKVVDEFVMFSEVEKAVEETLEPYQDQYINEVNPFDSLNPTLENLTKYLGDQIGERLKKEGWLLIQIEVAETPSRIYIIDYLQDS
ncbi:MAG: 6-carboxytetrahydropterin synthase [Eubacterium sp.]|nr:6-carboxytetrahydropterin synthase [Eubacterium sp.]